MAEYWAEVTGSMRDLLLGNLLLDSKKELKRELLTDMPQVLLMEVLKDFLMGWKMDWRKGMNSVEKTVLMLECSWDMKSASWKAPMTAELSENWQVVC